MNEKHLYTVQHNYSLTPCIGRSAAGFAEAQGTTTDEKYPYKTVYGQGNGGK